MIQQSHQRGFSLVELIITIFLVTFILGAAYTVYFGSSKATTLQLQDARMQDNARMAIDRISRNIASTGFMVDFSKYHRGHQIDGLTTKLRTADNAAAPDNVQFIAVPVPGGSSVLSMNAVIGNSWLTVQNVAPFNADACATVGLSDTIAIGLSDTAVVSNVVGNVLNLGFTSSGLQKMLNLNYPGQPAAATQTPTIISRLASMTYSIDTTDPAHPVFMENGMPLADDIEDFQIAYGVDRDNNKRIDATEWTNTPTLDEINIIRLIRVTVVARASHEDASLRGVARQVIAIENRGARDVTADGYRRYILSRIIYTENMDLLLPM